MEPVLIPCEIARDSEPVRTETVVYECGLRVLTLATTSADLLMQLVGTYTGDDRLPQALVSEAIELPDGNAPELRTRQLPVPPAFVTLHRDLAVADHLEAFCGLASDGQGGSFEVISRPGLASLLPV